MVLVCSILTVMLSTVPCLWLVYLIVLHTYLILTKKTTIQLILESRAKNRIKPKYSQKGHPIFKVSFSKNTTDKEVIRKADLPTEKEE